MNNMGLELLAFGVASNFLYASAGYFKAASQDKAKFDWKAFVRTVVIGAVPPAIVLGLQWLNITVPADQIVAMLGPALDKVLKGIGI